MLLTTKYVRKPLFVDAVRVTGRNWREVATWCNGEMVEPADGTAPFIQVEVTNPLNVRQSQARIGDWILSTDRGYKVYTPKAFDNSFDPVPSSMLIVKSVPLDDPAA